MPRGWRGGPLRLVGRKSDGGYQEIGPHGPREFVPLVEGWAVEARELHRPLHGALRGVELEFEPRDGRLQCVAVRSRPGGPELTWRVLRTIEKAIREQRRLLVLMNARRLVRLEGGELAAVDPLLEPRPGTDFNEMSEEEFQSYVFGGTLEVYERERRGPGRPRVADEQLQRVAELYREAEGLGLSRTSHIAAAFPNYGAATIRNWIRKARERGFLARVERRAT